MRLILLLLAVFAEGASYNGGRVVNPYKGPGIITPVPVLNTGLPHLTPSLNSGLLVNPSPVIRLVPGIVPAITPAITPQLTPGVNPLSPVLGSVEQVTHALTSDNASASPEAVLNDFFQGKASLGAPVQTGSNSGSVAPQGVTGKALLLQLAEKTRANYKTHDYDVTSDQLFSVVDNVEKNGVRGVVDAYSGVFVPGRGKDGDDYPEPGDENGDGERDRAMNVEHVWPQSFFSKKLPMKSDLHHLFTTFVHPNGVRGHLPFGEVKGRGEYQNSAGAKMGQGVFEPPNFTKGKVARAMLYFYTKYHDKNIYNGAYQDQQFWNSNLEMFLRWNRMYPPDQDEKNRNDRIEAWQGNRNPYIDDHTLADKVGVEGFRRGGKAERLQQRYSTGDYNSAFKQQQQGKRKHKKRRHKNEGRWRWER